MVFNKEQKKLILIGYLKWQKPIAIANLINTFGLGPVKAFDVYNYIQMMEKHWVDKKPFCVHCNVPTQIHRRCMLCEKLIHNDDKCCLEALVLAV